MTSEVLHRIGCHRASPSREEGVPSEGSFIIRVGVAQPLNRQSRLFFCRRQRGQYFGYVARQFDDVESEMEEMKFNPRDGLADCHVGSTAPSGTHSKEVEGGRNPFRLRVIRRPHTQSQDTE